MKRLLPLLAFAVLICSQSFAAYIVVLKDGTRYKAKTKWTVTNGKAIVTLENGQTLVLNPNEIDAAKSEELSKLGLGDVNVLSTSPQTQPQTQTQKPTLGQLVRGARRPTEPATPVTQTAPAGQSPNAATTTIPDQTDARLRDTFERAYENVGIFEHKISGTNRNIRVDLTADNEDKVFSAISATAFLIQRNAGLEGNQIDMVELFMKTTTGGSAGRFQMSRADADALSNKSMSLQDYFIRRVIY
ncbi:MAG TPA: hypothetical protein VLV78_05425 [Thermoanaerobaculia bacterium]|nr:hypothetical protein [Thermoanaerobaculia bacterium]